MADYQNVFKRVEKKYMLTKEQYESLRKILDIYMKADDYGLHTINNIYYDTNDYKLIRASLDKPVYKEKLRLRSYGTPTDESQVFLEIKKKYKGIVYKRRASMTLNEARKYLEENETPDNKSQIINEIDWFLKSYKLYPKAYVAYDRIAMYGKENKDLRITFDFNIRCRDRQLDLSKGPYGQQILKKDNVLMEIKIPNVMPMWLSEALDELKIYSTSFSKYGTYYKEYLINDFKAYLAEKIIRTDNDILEKTDEILGGIICA